jgi:hypothetical protein
MILQIIIMDCPHTMPKSLLSFFCSSSFRQVDGTVYKAVSKVPLESEGQRAGKEQSPHLWVLMLRSVGGIIVQVQAVKTVGLTLLTEV